MVDILVENRAAAGFDLKEFFEAGLVLKGTEVKAARAKLLHLGSSFVRVVAGEAFVTGLQIGRYLKAEKVGPGRSEVSRKLLLKREEIDRLVGLISQKGWTAVPLKVYIKNNYLKLRIGAGPSLKKWQRKSRVVEKQRQRQADRVW